MLQQSHTLMSTQVPTFLKITEGFKIFKDKLTPGAKVPQIKRTDKYTSLAPYRQNEMSKMYHKRQLRTKEVWYQNL